MIKSDQFVTILGWMRNIPEIQSNNELLAYALIYGFSQTEGQYLTCKQSYIAEWLKISRENCSRILKKLENEGLVKKQLTKKHGAIKMYRYYAVKPSCTSDETSHVECCNVTRASDETSHATSDETSHAYDINNNINILYRSRSRSQQQKKNQFCGIKQHDYDFEELERIALQKVVDNLRDGREDKQ